MTTIKEAFMKKRVFAWGLCLALAMAGVGHGQVDRSGEVAVLLSGLDSSSRSERIATAKNITKAGLVDPALYEKVAALLQAGYGTAPDGDPVDEMAWLCKALAASGDTKYQALLEEVAAQAPSAKLQKYARQSIDSFAEYRERSQVLNATEGWNAALDAEENRLVNMLGSENHELKRDAAKTIVRDSPVAEAVYDAAAAALTGMLENGTQDSLAVDTMAWLCKALGASGNAKYVAPLEQVEGLGNKKLSKFAATALQDLR
jgi:hypothetical protein